MNYAHRSCCDTYDLLDLSKMKLPFYLNFCWHNNYQLWISLLFLITYPIFWNMICMYEHKNNLIYRLVKSHYGTCVLMSFSIMFMVLCRDWNFLNAISNQPKWLFLQNNVVLWVGHLCVLFGLLHIFFTCCAKGFVGTFLGRYVEILSEGEFKIYPYTDISERMFLMAHNLVLVGVALVQATMIGVVLAAIGVLCNMQGIKVQRDYILKGNQGGSIDNQPPAEETAQETAQ